MQARRRRRRGFVHGCDADDPSAVVVGDELGGEFRACDLDGVDVVGEWHGLCLPVGQEGDDLGDVVAGEPVDDRELVGAVDEHRPGTGERSTCEQPRANGAAAAGGAVHDHVRAHADRLAAVPACGKRDSHSDRLARIGCDHASEDRVPKDELLRSLGQHA